MEFRVLGPVRVFAGGDEVRLRPLERHLLAALLTQPGRPLSTDALIDEVWADDPGDRLNALRVHLSNLRSRLRLPDQPSQVVSTAAGYVVAASPDAVDAARLSAALSTCRTLRDADPEQARAAARSAIGDWGAEPFAGLDSPLVNAARSHLTRVRGELIDLLVDLESTIAERPDRVLLHALALDDQGSEQRALAAALAEFRAGDAVAALAALRRLRSHLDDEFGLRASGRVTALEERILREESPEPGAGVRRTPGTPRTPGASDRPPATARTIEALRAGSRGVILTGERGMGKSEVLRSLALALPRAVQVPGKYGPPLGPVAGLLGRLGADASSAGLRDSRALAALVTRGLEARRWPVVLVDDADRLDPDSAQTFARIVADPRVTAVVSATDAPAARRLWGTSGAPLTLALERIDDTQCLALLAAVGCPSATISDAAELRRRSGGNPLLATSWAREFARTGSFERLPASIAQHARQLRSDVPDEHLPLLDLAVADGDVVDLALLARASGGDADRVLAAVECFVALGLVNLGGRASFVPGVVEALREVLGPRLGALCVRLGRAASAEPEPDWERAADLYTRAGDAYPRSELAVALARAGAAQAASGGLLAAEAAYRRAIEVGARCGTPADALVGWRLARARCAMSAGRVTEGCELARQAAVAAELSGRAEDFAEASVLAASAANPSSVDRIEAQALLERAVDLPLATATTMRVLEAYGRALALDVTAPAHLDDTLRSQVTAAMARCSGAEAGLGYLALRQLALRDGRPAAERLALSSRATSLLRTAHDATVLHAMRVRMTDACEAADPRFTAYAGEYRRFSAALHEPFHEWLALRTSAGDGSLSEADADRCAALEPAIDPESRLLADQVAGLAGLIAQGRFDVVAQALDRWTDPDPTFGPVVRAAALGCHARAGAAVDGAAVAEALAALTRHGVHVPGFALGAWAVAALAPDERAPLARLCLDRLMPHRESRVIVEGGIGRLGPVDEFLAALASGPS